MIEAAALDFGEIIQIVRRRGSKRSACVDKYSTSAVDGRGDARWDANDCSTATMLETMFKTSLAIDTFVVNWSFTFLNAENIIWATRIAAQIVYQE